MCTQDTGTRDICTPDMGTRDTFTQDVFTRIRGICIRAMRTRDTRIRDTPGMMDIVAGTGPETSGRAVIEITGRAADMFGRSGVLDGRRGDGHMASAGTGAVAAGVS